MRVLLRLLRMMGVVNLGSRLKIHRDGSAEERLGRRKFYSDPRDAAPADSVWERRERETVVVFEGGRKK